MYQYLRRTYPGVPTPLDSFFDLVDLILLLLQSNLVGAYLVHEGTGEGIEEFTTAIIELMTSDPSRFLVRVEQPFLEFQHRLAYDPFIFLTVKECIARSEGLFPRSEFRSAIEFLRSSGCLVATGFLGFASQSRLAAPSVSNNQLANPMDPMEVLPVEILCGIFHQLDARTISMAEQVNKKWQR